MSKPLNVGQLKAILNKYDDNVVPVVYHDGKGHYHLIYKDDIELESNVYFPDGDVEFPKKQQFLKVGIT